MGWGHLRLSAKIWLFQGYRLIFFSYGELFLPYLRLTVKILQLLRLSTKFWAALRLFLLDFFLFWPPF